MDPSLADTYNNRAAVFLNAGFIEQAIFDLNTAINLDPEFGLAFSNRAVAHALIGNLDLLEKDLDMAVILGVDREQLLLQINQLMDANNQSQ